MTAPDLCKDCNVSAAMDEEDYCEGCIISHTCAGCGGVFDLLPTGILCLACAAIDEDI